MGQAIQNFRIASELNFKVTSTFFRVPNSLTKTLLQRKRMLLKLILSTNFTVSSQSSYLNNSSQFNFIFGRMSLSIKFE